MFSIVIATHGTYAAGIKSAMEVIMGERPNVHTVCCYTVSQPAEELLHKTLNRIPEEDVLVICTDLFGGSVNQKVLGELARENVHIISGVNLPVLLELAVLEQEEVTADTLREIVANARQELCYAADRLAVDVKDDFDEL